MSRRVRGAVAILFLLGTAPLAVYLYLKVNLALDLRLAAPYGHFHVVSAVSLMAAGISIAIGIAGVRLRNAQVTFLAMAFCSLAFVFALHGLSTPGFILPPSQVPGMASQLSILLTALWVWLSSLPPENGLVARLSRRQRPLIFGWTAALVAAVALGMLFPQRIVLLPIHESPLKWFSATLTLGCLFDGWRRYWGAYRYSQFPLQFAILCSIGWLAGAQVIIVTGEVWRISWWIYHLLLLAAMLAIAYGLIRQYAADASITAAVKRLFATDPEDRIEAGIAPSIRAFVIATEMRDRYTAGHNYRVAIMALRLGDTMGLSPEQLRALAQGAVVHDVGKIEVPDQVLNKPGRLTPEERLLVERHPVTGFAMCRRMGFMEEELQIVRHHHERWDGTGYPDRLKGDQIPLLARVVSIADVYDAVTSARSYRQPWSHEQAMSLILEESGKAFDPNCVEAWVQASGAGMQIDRYPSWLQVNLVGLRPGEVGE